MINKDRSIVTQVAAKIAADLVVRKDNISETIVDWSIAFSAVLDALSEEHGFDTEPAQPADTAYVVMQAFPNTTVAPAAEPQQMPQAPRQTATGGGVQVAGTQHGPLPDWLAAQCAASGVTRVWDNRDSLTQNPKRPWFKAADGTKNAKGEDIAFWPPKGR
jgi:hypothetical protein